MHLIDDEEYVLEVLNYYWAFGHTELTKKYGTWPYLVLKKMGLTGNNNRYSEEEIQNFYEFYKLNGIHKTGKVFGYGATSVLKKRGLWEKKQFKNEVFIDRFLESPDRYYWAGFIAADGWIDIKRMRVGIELSIIDIEHLKKLKNLIGGGLYTRKRVLKKYPESGELIPEELRKVREYAYASIYSKKFIEFLLSLNITPKKSLTLKPPPNILSETETKLFIRGFFDGDGGISISNDKDNTVAIDFLSTKEFLEYVLQVLKDVLEIKCKISTKGKIYRLRILRKVQILKFLRWLYGDGVEPKLNRKYDKFQQALKSGFLSYKMQYLKEIFENG